MAVLCLYTVLCAATSQAVAQVKTKQWLSYYQQSSNDDFSRIYAFLEQNPDWPARRSVQIHAESKLNSGINDAVLLKWFEAYPPITSKASDIYMQTLKRNGRAEKARAVLREWWADANLTRDQQRDFYARYKDDLSTPAHKKRLDTLLYRGDSGNSRAIASVLGGGYPALSEARLALRSGSSNVNGLIAKVPSNLQGDFGLLYERLRWRRKNDLDDGARQLLMAVPDAHDMHDPDAWWLERHIIIRRLLEKKQYEQAYSLAASNRQKEGLPFAQAEWIAGWLALNFLNNPKRAFAHFHKLYGGVKSPISRARAAYWAGVAAHKWGYKETAQEWLAIAAQYDTTFYGQMAKGMMTTGTTLFDNNKYANSGGKISTAYNALELTYAARYLKSIKKKEEASLFVIALRNTAKNADDLKNNAILARELGVPVLTIRATSEAQTEYNTLYTDLAYPIWPQDMRDVKGVEWALVHALMRQESRFDQYAVSHAGARGLMQLMPATAKQVARKHSISHQTDWLTSRPSHNIALGSRYVKELLDRYDNNYALALAAYNAGPGRVDKWLITFGDPRKGQVDLVDWIELIPIYETRNYVQRVLEATYVYRGLLNGVQPHSAAPIHVAMR